jgi:hypothetical protein
MRLADYLEGDLPLSERALVDAHLDQCESCAAELSGLQKTVSLLRSLPDPEPPAGLSQAVIRRLREGEGQPGFRDRVQRFLSDLASMRIAAPATAAAVLVVVAVASGDLDLSGLVIGLGDGATSAVAVQPEVSPQARQVAREPQSLVAEHPEEGQTGFLHGRVPVRPRSSGAPAVTPQPNSASDRLLASLPESVQPPREVAPTAPAREATTPRVVPVAGESPHPGGAPRPEQVMGGADYMLRVRPGTRHPAVPDLDKVHRVRLELDRRLDLLIRDPSGFFRYLRTDSTAAQELWMVELAERAMEREIADQALDALRRGGDLEALFLADVFESAVQRADRERVASESVAGDR